MTAKYQIRTYYGQKESFVIFVGSDRDTVIGTTGPEEFAEKLVRIGIQEYILWRNLLSEKREGRGRSMFRFFALVLDRKESEPDQLTEEEFINLDLSKL